MYLTISPVKVLWEVNLVDIAIAFWWETQNVYIHCLFTRKFHRAPLIMWNLHFVIWTKHIIYSDVHLYCWNIWSNWLLLVVKSKWFTWPAGKSFLIRGRVLLLSHYLKYSISNINFTIICWCWLTLLIQPEPKNYSKLWQLQCFLFSLTYVKLKSYLRAIPHKCFNRIIICYWSELDNETKVETMLGFLLKIETQVSLIPIASDYCLLH